MHLEVKLKMFSRGLVFISNPKLTPGVHGHNRTINRRFSGGMSTWHITLLHIPEPLIVIKMFRFFCLEDIDAVCGGGGRKQHHC